MKTFEARIIRSFLFFVLISFISVNGYGQIKLSQPLSPGGTFGLVDVNELKGGLMLVEDIAQRDNIYMNRTKRGMLVVVEDADLIKDGEQIKCFMFFLTRAAVVRSLGFMIFEAFKGISEIFDIFLKSFSDQFFRFFSVVRTIAFVD